MHAEQLIKKTRAEAAAAASVPYTATAVVATYNSLNIVLFAPRVVSIDSSLVVTGATNREVDAVKAKAQAQAIAKMLGSQKKLSGRTSAMK
ncbi:hypothetical protein SARC_13291 [Sphaeroforma arctica JP610]|uniref:Uncharacterized protein n=1 Tax=Sphaeroforma arctica JP610 TaxID=667725 RepID=A0A0L0FBQ6_9EUKA|nr:hypothetical protein SARC_13291 [Sphaeroforma arctica JP610]KNC74154.1 hypothetical protein SARC_13291 [Sphaeroforma arctica JP610]|eukprot:XP_014148056.1 hypothetical protein SARC_13291 [Sphaeroforma arctica JP610]